MSFYIGVDGGGTKTAYALFNEQKQLLRLHEGPGSNHENLEGGFDEAAGLIWEGLQALLAGPALDDIAFTLMGLAGVDHPYQRDALMQRLTALGLAPLEVCNDGLLAVKAGCGAGAGIALNLGTGTVCTAIDCSGACAQLGGLGEFSGDVGNGTWLMQRAFALAYHDCILGVEPTMLTGLIFAEFNLTRPEELLSLLEDEPRIAKPLVRLFFEAANAGDPPALRVIDQMATRGAQLVAAHLRTLDLPEPCEVVLSGSIHTKLPNEIYIDLLKRKAEEMSGRALSLIKLTQPPVVGCINWIMEEFIK